MDNEVQVSGWLKLMVAICSSLSILGCGFILISAWIFGKWHFPYWRLVLCSAVSDLVHALCLFVAAVFVNQDTVFLCYIQGMFLEVFDLVGNWYMLALAIYLCVLAGYDFDIPLRIEGVIHLFMWVVPLSIGLLPVFGVLGMSYDYGACGWCWIGKNPSYARYLMFYAEQWVIIFLIIVLYIATAFRLHRRLSGFYRRQSRQHLVQTLRQIYIYPVVMLIVWVPCSLNRILEDVESKEYKWAEDMEAFVLPLWGFFDTIAYICTAQLYADYLNLKARLATDKNWGEVRPAPMNWTKAMSPSI